MAESKRKTSEEFYAGFVQELKPKLTVQVMQEMWQLLASGLPLSFAQLLGTLALIQASFFCGHLGREELAAAGLAVVVINMVGNSVARGMAAACDTLMTQNYGNEHTRFHVGIILQRGILISIAAFCVCTGVILSTKPVVALFKESSNSIMLMDEFIVCSVPYMPAYFLYIVLERYLAAQGINTPSMISWLLNNIVTFSLHMVLIWQRKLSICYSGLSISFSMWLTAIFLLLVIKVRGLHKLTWKGWTWECLSDWGSYMKLSLSGLSILLIEWCTFEMVTFVTGFLGNVALDIQIISMNIIGLMYTVPYGIAIALAARVGNLLGAQLPENAKFSAIIGIGANMSVTLLFFLLIVVLHKQVPQLFTSDPEVISNAQLTVIVAGLQTWMDTLQCSACGVLKGCAMLHYGVFINFIGHCIIGVPIGLTIMFCTSLGTKGFWLGMICGSIIEIISHIALQSKIDWTEASWDALERTSCINGPLTYKYGCIDVERNSKETSGKKLLNKRLLIFLLSLSALLVPFFLRYVLPYLMHLSSNPTSTNSTVVPT